MIPESFATRFELSHDAVARLVFDQSSAEAQARRKIEKYVRDRHAMYRERGLLLTRDDLDYIRPHLAAIQMDDAEGAFLRASEDAVRRARRRRRVIVASVIAVLAVSSGVSAVMAVNATRAKESANRATARAQAEALFNEARTELASGALMDAVQTARTALRDYPSEAASARSRYAVLADPTAVLLTIRERLDSRPRVRFSDDGRQILSVTRNSVGSLAARIWDWSGREVYSVPQTYRADWARGSSALIVGFPSAPMAMRNDDGSICSNEVRDSGSDVHGVAALGLVDLARPDSVADLAFGLQAVAPNGMRVSVCGSTVSFDDDRGTTLQTFRVPDAEHALFTPDGERIVVSGRRSTGVYDRSGTRLFGLAGGSAVVASDGRRFATVQGGTTIVWDAEGREIARYDGVSPVLGRGDIVVTARGATSRLWRRGPDETPAVFDYPGGSPRVSSDGVWVMTTTADGRTYVGDAFGHALTTLDGGSGQFSPHAPVAMTATTSGVVRLWDLRRVDVHTAAAASRIWQVDQALLDALPAELQRAECPCVAPDGTLRASYFAMGVTPGMPFSASFVLEVTDTTTGADTVGGARMPTAGNGSAREWHPVAVKDSGPCSTPVTVALSPVRGGDVAFGCGGGDIRVFDRTGAMRWKGKHAGAVNRVVFSSDGRHVLTSSADRTARLWDAASGTVLATLGDHESEVTTAIASPDARRVATLSARGVLRLWDATGRMPVELARIALDDEIIASVTFTADGSQVLARTRSGDYRRWLTNGALLEQEFAWLPAP